MRRQKLIILAGLPAVGKTKYAKEYIRQHPNTVIVSSDRVSEDMATLKIDTQDKRKIYEEMRYRVKKSLSYGKDVIVNATNLKIKYREPYIKIGKKFPNLDIEAHVIVGDLDDCAASDKVKKQLGLDFLKKSMGEFQIPLMREGFSSIKYEFVSEKVKSSEKEMPEEFFVRLLANGGQELVAYAQAVSILLEWAGEPREVQMAGFLAPMGMIMTKGQEFPQYCAYFLLCHLEARANIPKDKRAEWIRIITLINYLSVCDNWSPKYDALLEDSEQVKSIHKALREARVGTTGILQEWAGGKRGKQ